MTPQEELRFEILKLYRDGVTNSKEVVDQIVEKGRWNQGEVVDEMVQCLVLGYIELTDKRMVSDFLGD
jgi:hypothetical protein